MAVVFSTARNSSATCAVDGKLLHSSYNPEREAEQFVAGIDTTFEPACIIIIEPALSYCTLPLRRRFPHAELCCIRLCGDFTTYDDSWDCVLYLAGTTEDAVCQLAETLFGHFGEERLCALLALAWPASERAFVACTRAAWEAIRRAVVKSRDVLYTRSHFSRRWLRNSVRLATQVRNAAIIGSCGNTPVIVAASGPSLRSSLPYLRRHRARYLLLAVSSALLPLLHAGVVPDMVLSTDGGHWAKNHLLPLRQLRKRPPLALAAEGACSAELFEEGDIVPLVYTGSLAEPLCRAAGLPFMHAQRNGTVSGTALQLALALTSGSVFLCGLDLAPAIGFQHTQPNALEKYAECHDDRLRSKETRAVAAQLASGSLAIYRDWFCTHSHEFARRAYRLSAHFPYDQPLGEMQDVDWDFFDSHAPKAATPLPLHAVEVPAAKDVVGKALAEELTQDRWDAELFPLEVVLHSRAQKPEEAAHLAEKLAAEKDALRTELCARCKNGAHE